MLEVLQGAPDPVDVVDKVHLQGEAAEHDAQARAGPEHESKVDKGWVLLIADSVEHSVEGADVAGHEHRAQLLVLVQPMVPLDALRQHFFVTVAQRQVEVVLDRGPRIHEDKVQLTPVNDGGRI